MPTKYFDIFRAALSWLASARYTGFCLRTQADRTTCVKVPLFDVGEHVGKKGFSLNSHERENFCKSSNFASSIIGSNPMAKFDQEDIPPCVLIEREETT